MVDYKRRNTFMKIHLEKDRSAKSAIVFVAGLLAAFVLSASSVFAQGGNCNALPTRSALETALNAVVDAGGNGGLSERDRVPSAPARAGETGGGLGGHRRLE